jgi:hypothetical protein
MSHKNISVLTSPLEAVRCQFEHWRESRKNRRERIPENLWSAAAGLRQQYSVNQISNALRLNYNDLKKRMPTRLSAKNRQEQEAVSRVKRLSSVPFIELDWQRGFSSSLSGCKTQADECVIEMEDAYGSKMRMGLKGIANHDLLELGKAFWSKSK